MVTQSHGIEAELVDGLGNLLSTVEGVEQGALKFITGVEPQAVGVGLAQLINSVLDARIAAEAAPLGPGAVGAGLGEFVKVGVDIVDMEEGCFWSIEFE